MYIGKVIGTVVATIKIAPLGGRKLLLVDQLDLRGNETGSYDIAVDVVQAGPGDTVLVIDEGNGARQILGIDPGAVRAVIGGGRAEGADPNEAPGPAQWSSVPSPPALLAACRLRRPPDQLDVVGLQARPSHKRAVNLRHGHKVADIVYGDASAVLDAKRLGGALAEPLGDCSGNGEGDHPIGIAG